MFYISDWICFNMAIEISLIYIYWVLWRSIFFFISITYLFFVYQILTDRE